MRYGSISLTAVGARLGAALDDGLAQPGDAGVGVDLQEQPARLDQEGFELRDAQLVFLRDWALRPAVCCAASCCARCAACNGSQAPNPRPVRAPVVTLRRLTGFSPWRFMMGIISRPFRARFFRTEAIL